MGKGKRTRERRERREGKGRLVNLDQERKERRGEVADRKRIAAAAVANGPERARLPHEAPLEDRPEYQAQMEAWEAAGCPRPGWEHAS